MTLDNFQQLFKRSIEGNQLFQPSDKILLAISGGMDSMLMAWAFHQAGINFSVAHCNFSLRAKESDADEELVRTMALNYGVPFYTRRFDTDGFASQQGISIQMAARELRYAWFEEIRLSDGCVCISLAQHAGDLTETMLINLIRGTGIAGLHGIRSVHMKLIRPFLFLKKKEIKELVALAGITYREDASNLSASYMRNKLRLEVIPILRQINPALEETFMANARRLASTERLFDRQLAAIRDELVKPDARGFRISVSKLLSFGEDASFVLHELLKEAGFSESVCCQVIEGLEGQPGKIYQSSDHCLILDRDFLLLEPAAKKDSLIEPDSLFIIDYPVQPAPDDQGNRFIACLDTELLEHPLVYRYWKPGDSFIPLGMKKKKKLSDFFIDNKIPLTEKKRIPLVQSGKNIIWVAGYRIDDRYKITGTTRQIIRLRYRPALLK